MRFAVRVTIPTDRLVKDPNFISNVEQFIKTNNVEAAYFYEAGGERSTTYILDLPSADQDTIHSRATIPNGCKGAISPSNAFGPLEKSDPKLAKVGLLPNSSFLIADLYK